MILAEELRHRYENIVFWGHRNTGADFHFIYQAWRDTLTRMDVQSLWVDDDPAFAHLVTPRSWVTAMDTTAQHLPVVDGADYVLHNFSLRDRIGPAHHLNLQVYTDEVIQDGRCEKVGRLTYFDREAGLLVQPWGSDLMAHEAMDPVSPSGTRVFWIGSVWDNELGQGNRRMITDLTTILDRRGLQMEVRRVPSSRENASLVRASRIAPAFAGEWQVRVNYLPCRVFKNVSYGQLGLTNVARFGDVMPMVPGDSLEEQVDAAMALDSRAYRHLVAQQQFDLSGFDYAAKMRAILRAFDEMAA